MQKTVFYSWQSDLPNATNRGFIQTALEKAARTIRNDDSVQIEPVIDRDTAGVTGAPDIAHTIFGKIDQASVFVCDVSIISRVGKGSKKRPTPNPNVLIELGYAIKTLGWNHIIIVMNLAYGDVKQLPFDLQTKRVFPYTAIEGQEKTDERRKLEAIIEGEFRTIFSEIEKVETNSPVVSLADETIAAIQNSRPNQTSLSRRYMDSLINKLEAIAPDFKKEISDDLLIYAINESEPLVIDFARICETIAAMNASSVAKTIYKGFEQIVSHYNNPYGFSGHYNTIEFDFFKFVGHELLAIFIGLLLQENRWEIISDILDDDLYVQNLPDGTSGTVSFEYLSQYVRLLDHRNERLKLGMALLHGELLNMRHTQGELANIVPMQLFIEADLLLFFSGTKTYDWKPWSGIYSNTNIPQFLIQAQRGKFAEQLLRPLHASNIINLREKISVRIPKLQEMFTKRNIYWTFHWQFDPQTIGSK